MSLPRKKLSIATTLCLIGFILGSCGGKVNEPLSNLDSPSGGNTSIAGVQAYGSTLRYDPNGPDLRLIPSDDPWGLPDLGETWRGVPANHAIPTEKQMLDILDKEFYRLGIDPARVVASAPSGNDNTVFNLEAEPYGSPIEGVRLSWTERIVGDFDQNSEVNISDLTQIVVNFSQVPSYDPPEAHGGIDYWPSGDPDHAGVQNWRLAAVDGDGNGEVNLSDITTIAIHFLERLDGYRVYRRLDGEGTFSILANTTTPGVDYTIGRPTTPGTAPVRYLFEDTAATSGNVEYYVAAFDGNASSEGGQSNAVSLQLSQGPTAQLDLDVSEGNAPLTVNFDAGSSIDPDGTIDKYEFDFGEGNGFEDFGTTFLADNEYTELGNFTASVRVTDNEGNTDVAARVINISGQEPVAKFHLDIDFGEVPLTVNFDATFSSDPDGSIETYEFDFGAGAGFVDYGTTTPFLFPDTGTHTIRLRVTDDDGLQNIYSRDVTTFNPGELVLPPLWEVAKANAEVSGSSMGFEELIPDLAFNEWTWGGGPWTDQLTMLPSFWEAWYTDVEAYPDFLSEKTQGLSTAGGLQDLFLEANRETLVQHNIASQTHISNLDPDDPLARALFDLATAAGGTPDFASLQADVAPLSPADRQALAELVDATQQAMELRNSTVLPFFLFDDFGYDFIKELFDGGHGAGPNGMWALRVDDALMYWAMYIPTFPPGIGVRFFTAFPYNGIYEGTAILADAIDTFKAYLATSPAFRVVNVEIDTPQGRITIAGTDTDTHSAPPDGNGHILLIDLGGNDIYDCHAGANASEYNGTSVCIDIGGDDTYNPLDDPDDVDRNFEPSNDNTAQQGTGRFGIGMLVDFGGVDNYTGVRMAQGCAVFGAGILADYGGAGDTYSFEALGQGGAFGGIGLLYDDGGADNYTCYSMAQGYGGIYGVGYLVDAGTEGDTYLAIVDGNPEMPEYDATDVYGSNLSIAQGAAWGARRDWINLVADPDSWRVLASGGQGLLYDEGGDDSYTCGTFGQGFGLYEGMGVLIDLEGNDVHSGHWYTQGATAHAAVGAVYDIFGDDTWDNEVSVGIGGAHDMSVSWFFDIFGDDTYNASGLAVGTGLDNSFGYFLDYFGDDTYNATYSTPEDDNLGIGKLHIPTPENPIRPWYPSYGIFVDTHGTDTYDIGYQGMTGSVGLPGDGMQWTRIVDFVSDPPSEDDKQGHGAGVDGPLLP